jgi:hypothetical protein
LPRATGTPIHPIVSIVSRRSRPATASLPASLFARRFKSLSRHRRRRFRRSASAILVNWGYLGPALPPCQFFDPKAPPLPQRYYRLRWP